VKKYQKTVLFLITILFLALPIDAPHAKTVKLKADLVVIGAGGAGLAAAVTAAEGGAKVIVFEKMPVAGGATSFAKGIFAVESRLQKERGIKITKDEAFLAHMDYTHWLANPRIVRAIIDKSDSTIDWLEKRGVEFIEPAVLYPGAPPTWHTIKGLGAGITKSLVKTSKNNNVQIHYRTTVKKLIMNNDRVEGLIAEDKDGNKIKTIARAVVIASGGFANNKEMLGKYTKAGPNIMAFGQVGKTGDGIKMAWEVGAGSEGTDVLQRGLAGIKKIKKKTLTAPKKSAFDKLITAILKQPYLWVNIRGERFYNEASFSFAMIGNAMSKQPGQILFSVFDENTQKYLMEHGTDVGLGVFAPKGTKIKDFHSAMQSSIDSGEAFAADSIQELAGLTGIDGKRLQATIDEYNVSCDKGHDLLFAKDPKYLQPVRTPRFYAIRGYPTFVGTLGGIKINHKTEVLKKNLDVIPGLYAAGNCAGGMYGDSYDASTTVGGTLAFAINSGRIAGENVLKFIGK
jgi:fumarate reductase flavoprotein subunit